MARKVPKKKINIEGRLEYDRSRGVIYFFGGKGCLLRIEGVPATAIEKGDQVDVHLVAPGCEHHHVDPKHGWGDGAICAVKLQPRK